MKFNTALLVGRFQPFHQGHLYLIKKTLEKSDGIVIGVGSANVQDVANPLSFEQRKRMLEIVIEKEKWQTKILKIVPLEDFHHDEKWLNNVKKQAGKFDVVVGNNEWTNGILERAGFPVLRFGFYKRYLYEGEKIRKLIAENGNWKERIPPYLVNYLNEILNPKSQTHYEI